MTNNINDSNSHNLFSAPHIPFEDDPFGADLQQPPQIYNNYNPHAFSDNFKGTVFDTLAEISQPAPPSYLNDFDNKFINGNESMSDEGIEELKRVLGLCNASTNTPNLSLVHGLARPFTPPDNQLTGKSSKAAPGCYILTNHRLPLS